MLNVFRQWNLGIKVILGFIILTFILFYAGSFVGGGKKDPSRNMAVVGKDAISNVDFQNMLRNIQQQQKQFMGDKEPSPQMMQFFRQEAVNFLVDRRLMLLEAKKAGITASDAEVIKAIQKSFSRNGQFIGMQEYEQIVDASMHMDVESFERMIADDIIVQKYNDLLTSGILVGDQELEDQYKKNNLTAKIDYVAFEKAGAESTVDAKPEDVRAYFDAHKQDFMTGEMRKVQYLWVSHDSEKNRVQLPETELRKYYDENGDKFSRGESVHARHILLKIEGKTEAEVKTQADELVRQLRAGADFAALAKQYSDDPGSKENGGDLGFFERGRMIPEFEQSAFSLEPNQISDPVKTMYGYHIIQTLEKKPASKLDFVLVKDQIARELAQPKAIANAQEQAKKIYDDIKNNHKNLADISKIQLIDLRTTDFFAKSDQVPGLDAVFNEKAFELKAKGDVAEPVQVFQDFAIIQLTDTKPTEAPPFEKVQAKVIEKYKEWKAEQIAQQNAQNFYNAIGAATDLKSVADKMKLTVKSTEPFNKGGYVPNVGTVADVSDKAFDMVVGAFSKPVKTDTGYIVFQLKEKKEFNQADFEKEKAKLRDQIVQEKKNDFLSTYRAMLHKKYEKDIWINTEAVNLKA